MKDFFEKKKVLLGYAFWFDENFDNLIRVFTFSVVVLRSELLILFGPIVLVELYLGKMKLLQAIETGILSGIFSLGIYFISIWN